MTNGWECRRVSLDGDPEVLAEVSTEQSWNGFAIVQMDAWSVEHVLRRLKEVYSPEEFADYGHDWDWREDGVLLLTDMAAVREVRDGAKGLNVTEELKPNGDGLYGLGSFGWVWGVDHDEDDGVVHGIDGHVSSGIGDYGVSWEIDIFDAEDPRDAAEKAYQAITEGSRIFNVIDGRGNSILIDLSTNNNNQEG